MAWIGYGLDVAACRLDGALRAVAVLRLIE